MKTPLLLLALAGSALPQSTSPLFDGKTFAGWEGDTKKWWRLEEGCIVGGSLKENVPHNDFLATEREFGNFVLRLKFRLLGSKGFINSGVQIRSQRVPRNHEMAGYQCDLGDPTWWGSIYDESRRNRVMAQSDMAALNKVLKRGDWNDYEIRAEGPRIVTRINGVLAVDYTEEDDTIVQKGKLGLQIHGGGAAEAWFKDITFEELPASPAAPKFEGAPAAPKASKPSPLTPDEERASFTVPPGFEVELVASEIEGVGKPITVTWDAAGRLWTMTALEYPVDANEDPQRAAALFKDGGRDRVLVIDAPHGPGPHTPRVFAEKLAMPLGLLPYKDGAFVQYGNELRYYRDRDGDGRADGHETVLQGFGIEDSHLFIHQFTRGPGGWIYMAQGAFNRTKVKTKEGPVVTMNFCKMARVQPDGSRFELCQAGLNNIWGFVIARDGTMWIQEANDLGYPLVPLEIGGNYPGIGMEKLKPYAPWQPALANHFQMGGTGLSGLALCEDRDGWPEPYAGVFYVANPITRRIQAIRARPDGAGWRLQKLPDFLLSADEWFRPIAIHFGPDGCLYIVDWYNKVISHNEVPRNHPDRDRTRGRIWRVRHKDTPRRAPANLAKAPEGALLEALASPNAREGRAAWLEIVDRGAAGLAPGLLKILSGDGPKEVRLRALWALEGLGKLTPDTLRPLLAHPDRDFRREAVRAVPGLASLAADDADPQVRAAAIRALGSSGTPDLAALVRMARDPLAGTAVKLQQGPALAKAGAAHDRDFERYLVRAALERHPDALAAFLDSEAAKALPAEGRLLASLALPPAASAPRVAAILPQLKRAPEDEELLRLAEFPESAGAGDALKAVLQNPAQRAGALESLLRVRNRLDLAKLTPLLVEAARTLWAGDDAARDLALRVGSAFKLSALEDDLAAVLGREAPPAQQLMALRALRELGSARTALFAELAKKDALRGEALHALAAVPGGRGAEAFLGLVPGLDSRERRLGLERLSTSPEGARAVVAALKSGALPPADLDGALLERLQAVLKDDAGLKSLIESSADLFRPVLALDGKGGSFADTDITLDGPFTVETWVRLEKGITNADSLLGTPRANINFHDAKVRLWGGPQAWDVVTAKKAVAPDAWTHFALTRDAEGKCRIYVNGEIDAESAKPFKDRMDGLDVGFTGPAGSTAGAFCEFRVWDRARNAAEIRAAFDQALEDPAPPGLVKRFGGAGPWGTLKGGARVIRTTDFPPLLTAAEAKAQEEKFARVRALAEKPGDVARGREVFAKTCAPCHTAEGKGGQIGPVLNGAGAMGTEALLRNILTPNASMEPGYRVFRLQTKDGDVIEGFLVNQDAEALLLRQQGSEDRRVFHRNVRQSAYTRRSLMPEGLLEALKPDEVSDLFAFLRALK